jgi:WXG100 family type VII secretion target
MSLINVTPEQVIELGAHTGTQRDKLVELTNAIESKVASTDWDSPAATRFKEDWAMHKSNLVKLQQALDSVAKAATQMGNNYQEADASYGKG